MTLLAALDEHPGLYAAATELVDEHWAEAYLANQYEAERALAYLCLLDADEVQRRMEFAKGTLSPVTGEVDDGPQECDVCGNETMNLQGGDDFGHGYAAGTCLVCSYCRSDDIAYSHGMNVELWRRLDKDA